VRGENRLAGVGQIYNYKSPWKGIKTFARSSDTTLEVQAMDDYGGSIEREMCRRKKKKRYSSQSPKT
jgi:hypothetical protein